MVCVTYFPLVLSPFFLEGSSFPLPHCQALRPYGWAGRCQAFLDFSRARLRAESFKRVGSVFLAQVRVHSLTNPLPHPPLADRAPSLPGRAPEGALQAAGGREGEAAPAAQHRAGKWGRGRWARGVCPREACSAASSPAGEAHCLLRAGDPASPLPGGEDHREPGGAVQRLHHAAGLRGLQHASGKSGAWPAGPRGASEFANPRQGRGRRWPHGGTSAPCPGSSRSPRVT